MSNKYRKFTEEFSKNNPPAPAPKNDTVDVYHGVSVPDPYRPLEDLDAKATSDWTATQNARFSEFVKDVEDKQTLTDHLKDIWEYPRESIPSRYNDVFLSSFYDGKTPQPIVMKRDSLEGEPTVLLDPNKLSEDGTIALSGSSTSPDGKYYAYLTSQSGSDAQTLHIKDIATGKDLPDVIEGCRFTGVSWDRDSSKGFQYTYPANDEKKRFVTKHHTVGEDVSKDKEVFSIEAEDSHASPFRLRDEKGEWGKFDFMSTRIGTLRADGIYMREKGTDKPFEKLFDDGKSTLDPVAEVDGKIYAVTSLGAPRGRLVSIDPAQPDPKNWETIIPEPEKDVLEWGHIQQGKLMVGYSHDTASKIAIHDVAGEYLHDVPLPPQSIASWGKMNPEDKELLVSVSGFQSPGTKYKYDIDTNEMTEWKKSAAKVDLSDAIVERIHATSRDGTQVPMTVIRGKDTKLDGTAAVKLYGYGGFASGLTPGYSNSVYNWVKEGGVYVQANLRGGDEFGKEWYDGGRLLNKQNTFDDFAACAEKLIEDKYTKPERIAIEGGSNGGLLTLATALQRPELFGAVISSVPVTDMLRFDKHTYGAAWRSDYGHPEKNKEDFDYSMTYSPLHNVKEGGKYPPILVKTADHDDRVVPSHAFKFVATFQEKAAKDSLCLMRVDAKAGHGAGKPTEKVIEELVETHAFLEQALGPISQEKYKASEKAHQHEEAKDRNCWVPRVADGKKTIHPRVNNTGSNEKGAQRA